MDIKKEIHKEISECSILILISRINISCDDIINRFAESLHVDIQALKVPNLSTPAEIMHMLFLLEDIIANNNNEELSIMINRWVSMSKKLKEGKITKRTYDEWRYNFK